MFPSQLVILLFAQVIFCSQRQKVQSLVSSQPGPFAFALSSDITYKPLVSVTQEPEEDTSRRQELFKNFYKVELASGVALAAPDTRMEVKSQPAKVVKSQQANQTKTVLPVQATRSETPVADELQGINILEDFDLGPRWHKHYLSHCESRVSVFNVPHDNIRDVLRVMIKFGPITEAWMIKDSPYGRPNIVLIEYANIADAGLAILQARGKFPTRVGVAPCKGGYVLDLTSIKIQCKHANKDMKQFLDSDFMEKFGPVVSKEYDERSREALVTFNWFRDMRKAQNFFSSEGCDVRRISQI